MTPLCKVGVFACALSCFLNAQPPANQATIAGIVYGASHAPLPGADVTIIGGTTRSVTGGTVAKGYNATSDSLGRFSFPAVEPGNYIIGATHPDYSAQNSSLNLQELQQINTTGSLGNHLTDGLTVAAGQHITNEEINLVPLTILSGKVTDENGNPIPNVAVRPMRADTYLNGRVHLTNADAAVQTNAEGGYKMTVASGRWYLSFMALKRTPAKPVDDRPTTKEPEQDYVPTYFPGVHDMSLALGVEAAGQPLAELNVRMQKSSIFDARGKLVGLPADSITPDYRVLPSQETGSGRPSIVDEGRQDQPDGTFDVAGLIPGAWTLIVCQYGKPDASFGRQTIRITDADLDGLAISVQFPVDVHAQNRSPSI